MTESRMFRRIGVEEAQALLAGGEAFVLDVRDADSFRRGHIDDAHHLTVEGFGRLVETAPKTSPILVCCYHGISSQGYARLLCSLGFQDVYSLDGGYEAWAKRAR